MKPAGVGSVIVVGMLVTTAACAAPAPPPSGADPTSTATTSPTPTSSPPSASPVAPATRARSVVAAQVPERAVLPSGRTVRINAVGTTTAGLLDVPDDVAVAGWWRGGARLGDPFGSILVAAHVDSRDQGLGPFAELLTVGRGTRVRLESEGLRQVFEVRSRRVVPQDSLPDSPWIFEASGTARLTLVTCAPPYDASRGGYQNLAVVTAVPLGPPEQP